MTNSRLAAEIKTYHKRRNAGESPESLNGAVLVILIELRHRSALSEMTAFPVDGLKAWAEWNAATKEYNLHVKPSG